jgi:hypothetical protein
MVGYNGITNSTYKHTKLKQPNLPIKYTYIQFTCITSLRMNLGGSIDS